MRIAGLGGGHEVIALRRPTNPELDSMIARARGESFSYPEVGATHETPPSTFTVDRYRCALPGTFERAVTAVRAWTMFRLGWVEPYPGDTPIEEGQTLSVLSHQLGLWTVNTTRVVYTVEEPNRFGFAYGTLPQHVEVGEERFIVEQDADGNVWYDVLAMSRPRHWMARLGYPISRHMQKRFGADSMARMREAVR